jgi:hypothetical protein
MRFAWAGGEDIRVRVTKVEIPKTDVRAVRWKLHLSQSDSGDERSRLAAPWPVRPASFDPFPILEHGGVEAESGGELRSTTAAWTGGPPNSVGRDCASCISLASLAYTVPYA